MGNRKEIILSGDIGSSLGLMVDEKLKTHQHLVTVRTHGYLVEEAYAIAPEDLIATAAAIAAVLDFFLNLAAFLIKLKDKKNVKAQAINYLKKNLKKYKADGFEPESLEFEKFTTQKQELRRVLTKDIPNQVLIEVERRSESEYSIMHKNIRLKTK